MRYMTGNIKMPRRLTALLTAAVCLYTAAAFVGCGKKSDPATTGYGELETLPTETQAPPEPPPPPRELDALEERLGEQLALYQGKWSVYVQDLSTGKEIVMNDRKVYAASEIKLFAMAAAYQQVEDGKLALVSVEDDVEIMISESDNYRFNRILEKIVVSIPDIMQVSRTSGTFSASFLSGIMYMVYSSSVPAGWLVPLTYIKVGRPQSMDEQCAKVRLIVPHSQGHASASSNVKPYYYVITFQRES